MIDLNKTHAITEAPSESTAYFSRTLQAIREGTSMAGILRMGGAGLMVFSLCLFLMQGMEATSDLQRYLLLLGQTVLLTGTGFAVGFVLKEPRGARVFFSLALISIPANFAVLGAMIYSIAPLDAITTQYPTYASWQSTNLRELLIAGLAGLSVLIPMSVFCFAVLARHSKWWLSAAYLLASASLLIPLRETFSMTLISSACAIAIVALLSNRHAKRQRLATSEEKFAKALLFIPATLMLARSAALYNVDFHGTLAIVIAAYYLLRRLVIARSGNSALTMSLQILSASAAFILAIMLTSLLDSNFAFIAPMLVFSLAWLGLNIELTRFIDNAKIRGLIHGSWAVVSFCAIATDTLLFGDANGFIVNVTLALVLLASSVITHQKLSAVLGTVALMGVLIVNGTHLFSLFLDTGWIGMAVTGATTIVAGSLLDRYWPMMKLRFFDRLNAKNADAMDMDAPELQEDLTSEPQAEDLPERIAA